MSEEIILDDELNKPRDGKDFDSTYQHLLENGYGGAIKRLGLPDSYVEHGSRNQILNSLSLDNDGIKNKIIDLYASAKEEVIER